MRITRQPTFVRRGAAVLGAGLLAGWGVLAATPAQAAASGTISSPANGSSYSTSQTLTVAATVTYANGDKGTAMITATDPDNGGNPSTGCAFQVASAAYAGTQFGSNSTPVQGSIDLNAAYPKSCPTAFQGKPAVNGRWQLTLATADSSVESFFTVAVPPATPTGVKGSSTAPLSVTVAWNPNPELDTHAYAITNAQGDVISGPVDATDACSSSSCANTFSVAGSGSQSFAVRAYRYVAPPNRPTSATTGDLTADSADVTVDVAAKPAAAPTMSAPGGAGGGSASGPGASKPPATPGSSSPSPTSSSVPASTPPSSSTTATATATPGAAARSSAPSSHGASQAAFGSGTLTLKNSKVSSAQAAKISGQFQTFAAPVGIDELPPLPKLDASGAVADLPAVAADDGEPTDQGTFKLSLGYGPQSKVVASRTSSPGTPLTFVADAIGISPSALWRSLAGSILLLLCAAHVRRWARQPIE